MQITVCASPRAPHQMAHQSAMMKGFSAIGIDSIANVGGAVNTKHVAVWGWRQGKTLRQRGHEVLVIERGYLGDRFKWTSLAWNGLNGNATFPDVDATRDRFDSMAEMRPWKEGGEYVLILGQVPGDASLQGKDMMPYYEQWAKKAAEKYSMPVKFRQHPQAVKRGYRQNLRYADDLSHGSLENALDNAFVTICWNSNSAVDSVLHGVPAVTLDKGAMAWDVSAHNIGEIIKPDRNKWASNLAWKQWSLDEIKSGEALKEIVRISNVS